jgi:hypothetical protein
VAFAISGVAIVFLLTRQTQKSCHQPFGPMATGLRLQVHNVRELEADIGESVQKGKRQCVRWYFGC